MWNKPGPSSQGSVNIRHWAWPSNTMQSCQTRHLSTRRERHIWKPTIPPKWNTWRNRSALTSHTCFPSPSCTGILCIGSHAGREWINFFSPELMTCVLQYALPTQSAESKNKMNEWILQWEAQSEDKQYDYLLGQEGKTFPNFLLPLLPSLSSLFLPVHR